MQFSSIISILSALAMASSVIAAPAAEPVDAASIVARDQQLIDVWDDAGFLGLKFTGSANVGDCKNFPSKFNNLISSGKAKKGFRCTIWVDGNCKGDGFSFNADPGVSKLPPWINDLATSWKCVKA
jgi:hypothetical protein